MTCMILRVTRIGGQSRPREWSGARSPLMAPESTAPGCLRHQVRLAGQVRLVHGAVAVDDRRPPDRSREGARRARRRPRWRRAGRPRPRRSCVRCATVGMRWASASSTDDARRAAYCSRASPPDSISTTNARRDTRRAAPRTIEMPARRSEPNSSLNTCMSSSNTSGTPPKTSTTRSGTSEAAKP